MAKCPYDAYIKELGPGLYKAKWFDPIKEQWFILDFISGFAEVKASLLAKKKNGKASFNKILVNRLTKGIY